MSPSRARLCPIDRFHDVGCPCEPWTVISPPPRRRTGAEAAGVRTVRTAADRRGFIRDQVHQSGSVTVDHLVATLDVSRMTIHRDLDALEHDGVLRKVRGGATAARSSLFESDLPYRMTSAVAAKAAIGMAAAQLLERGQACLLYTSRCV